MLTPPFTILIVKDKRSPVTVRITTGLAMMGLATVVGVLIAMLIGLSALGGRETVPGLAGVVPGISKDMVLIREEPAVTPVTATGPDVRDITVSQSADGQVEIFFGFSGIPADEEVFAWLVVNPGATSDETALFPRGPLFRGLPVDYRNGIRYQSSSGNLVTITFAGPQVGIDLVKFRILAYSHDGVVLVDRTIAVENTIKL